MKTLTLGLVFASCRTRNGSAESFRYFPIAILTESRVSAPMKFTELFKSLLV